MDSRIMLFQAECLLFSVSVKVFYVLVIFVTCCADSYRVDLDRWTKKLIPQFMCMLTGLSDSRFMSKHF